MSNKSSSLDALSSVFKGKFIGLSPYVRKAEKQEIVFVWKYYKKLVHESQKKNGREESKEENLLNTKQTYTREML